MELTLRIFGLLVEKHFLSDDTIEMIRMLKFFDKKGFDKEFFLSVV